MQNLRKTCLLLAAGALLVLAAGLAIGNPNLWRPASIAATTFFAIGLGGIPSLRTYQFTAWIVAAVVAAMVFPAPFLMLNPDDSTQPRNKWIMLLVVQLVMFGMGTQMSVRDFTGLGRMSWGVVVGLVLQFSIMPIVGYTIAKAFDFPPEIAAGMVLIGSCSSGLASNVMAYIARANLALSVTLTAVGTIIAPVMTPLWMKNLAGEMVQVDFVSMMLQIVKLVIVPIGAALIHDYLKRASPIGRRIVFTLGGIGVIWLAAVALGGWNFAATRLAGNALNAFGVVGFLWAAVVAGVVFHALAEQFAGLEPAMPICSMFGITFFTAITTAAGREELIAIGWQLLAAVILHNLIGYVLGYWMCRACGLDKNSARTIALEVGIHNGGMATGIATGLGKLATVGLPAAIFSPWMNVSGSLLANYWRKRPVDSTTTPASRAANEAE